MPFEIPANIHPDVARLAWLVGRWAGNGHGGYPGIEPYRYAQEIVVQQDGRPFLHYFARSWVVDEAGDFVREGAQETGFFRGGPDGQVELLLTHATGYVEVWVGEVHPEQPRFEIVTDAVARVASAEDYAPTYVGGKRLYGYVHGDLLYASDMVTTEHELQSHIHAQLARQA